MSPFFAVFNMNSPLRNKYVGIVSADISTASFAMKTIFNAPTHTYHAYHELPECRLDAQIEKWGLTPLFFIRAFKSFDVLHPDIRLITESIFEAELGKLE